MSVSVAVGASLWSTGRGLKARKDIRTFDIRYVGKQCPAESLNLEFLANEEAGASRQRIIGDGT